MKCNDDPLMSIVSADLPNLKPGEIIKIGGDSHEKKYKWIEAEQSPFGTKVLDMGDWAYSKISMTDDQSVIDRIINSERTLSFGLPEEPEQLPIKIEIDQNIHCDGVIELFKASRLEEKWDILCTNEYITISRSWTGSIAYTFPYRIDSSSDVEKIIIEGVVTTKERFKKYSIDFIANEIIFILNCYAFGEVYPHPIPKNIAQDIEKCAEFSYSQHGCRASFGIIV